MKYRTLGIIVSIAALMLVGRLVLQETTTAHPGQGTLSCEAVRRLSASRVGLVHLPDQNAVPPELDAFWSQPFPGPFVWGRIQSEAHSPLDFSGTDTVVASAQAQGISQLGILWPYAEWEQPGGRSRAACRGGGFVGGLPSSRCRPTDTEAYSAFVAGVIERYDGDGIYDLEGLCEPLTHWEVASLPAQQTQRGGWGMFRGDAVAYYNLLRVTFSEIKASCPQCVIHFGAIAGDDERSMDFLDEVLRLGGADYFDVVSLHTNLPDAERAVTEVLGLLDAYHHPKPVWVTALRVSSEDPNQVTERLIQTFAAGAEKIFFADVSPDPGEIPYEDRIYLQAETDQSRELKEEVQKLAHFVGDYEELRRLEDGIYEFRMSDGTVNIIAWREGDTTILPKEIRGQLQITTADGTLVLKDSREVELGDTPVFITRIK